MIFFLFFLGGGKQFIIFHLTSPRTILSITYQLFHNMFSWLKLRQVMEAKNPKMAKLFPVTQTIYLKIVAIASPLCMLDRVTHPPSDPSGKNLPHISAIPPKGTVPKPLKIGS